MARKLNWWCNKLQEVKKVKEDVMARKLNWCGVTRWLVLRPVTRQGPHGGHVPHYYLSMYRRGD